MILSKLIFASAPFLELQLSRTLRRSKAGEGVRLLLPVPMSRIRGRVRRLGTIARNSIGLLLKFLTRMSPRRDPIYGACGPMVVGRGSILCSVPQMRVCEPDH